MTKTNEVLGMIKGYSKQGVGVTRNTVAGSLGWPMNRVSSRIAEMLRKETIVERGSVVINTEGRPYRRALLGEGEA